MQNKELKFRNGKFRIMQIADTQESAEVAIDTIRFISAALEREKPDLVIFTGDQIKGYSSSFQGKKGRENVRKVIKALVTPLEQKGIPFAMTFGNHDGDSAMTNSEQFEIYKESPMFVYSAPVNDDDKGTYYLTVTDDNGVAKRLIYLFDSHSKDPDGGYSAVQPYQIDWYRGIRDSYDPPLPSIAFQHIPAPEYFEVIKQVGRFSKGSVRAYGNHKNEWYVLDPDNCGQNDFMGETPAAPFKNTGEIDAFLEKKEMEGLFVGHDHNNSFVADYKGIKLGYSQGCGFNVYGPGYNRGFRILDLDENGGFESKTVTFSDIFDKNDVTNKGKFFIYSYAPTSVSQVLTAAKEIAIVALGAGATALVIKNLRKIKKK
ncbi:MAG: metallophosphoesterase family protein [Clostridia bacterium]|nr:metallophosphoesterase family protein [Clostridia bacterium]